MPWGKPFRRFPGMPPWICTADCARMVMNLDDGRRAELRTA